MPRAQGSYAAILFTCEASFAYALSSVNNLGCGYLGSIFSALNLSQARSTPGTADVFGNECPIIGIVVRLSPSREKSSAETKSKRYLFDSISNRYRFDHLLLTGLMGRCRSSHPPHKKAKRAKDNSKTLSFVQIRRRPRLYRGAI